MTTVNDIKAYLDTMRSDDPALFQEVLDEIMTSCQFWGYKLKQAGMTIIQDAVKEKEIEKCSINIDNGVKL